MDLLCDLGIRLTFSGSGMRFTVDRFFSEPQTPKPLFYVREFEPFEVDFKSADPTDRLYLEGLDFNPGRRCECDETGHAYLKPDEYRRYVLFDNDVGFHGMRVGVFEIDVIHQGKRYRQYYEVLPKHIDAEGWAKMTSDLEHELPGLSSDVVPKSTSLFSAVPSVPQPLYRFFVMKKKLPELRAQCMRLKNRAERADEVYALVRQAAELCTSEIAEFQKACEYYIAMLDEEIAEHRRYGDIIRMDTTEELVQTLMEYCATAEELMGVIRSLRMEAWYTKAQRTPVRYTNAIRYQPGNAGLYRLVSDCMLEMTPVEGNEEYGYLPKPSNRMYEIWCFIKLCHFLMEPSLGFVPENKIFTEEQTRSLIPFLESGTMAAFRRGEYRIKMYYDARIAGSEEETDRETLPIYSKSAHKRPDIRMDLYKGEVYWATLIFEVKYRTINSFWHSAASTSKQQIRAYKNDISSPYSQGLPRDYSIRKIRPVDRVWVLHPTNSAEFVTDNSDEGIRFVGLRPGRDESECVAILKEEIKEAFQEGWEARGER